jgi:3-dehydroquinate dehydratase / shikimate dehydrogenase
MSAARLCVTVTGATTAELRAARDAAAPSADLVELRLDGVDDLDLAAALQGRRTPVIATCRPVWEGGRFEGSEEERRRLLHDARRLGAEYIDVEWRAGFDDLVRAGSGRGVILSLHDFEAGPDDLERRYRAMRATGAEVVKLAIRVRALRELLPLLAIGRAAAAAGEPVVLVGMGDAGLASRVLAARFGSAWMYAGAGVAPGQISAERLEREFGFRRLGPASEVYGVVGRPLVHSVSPAMHNAAIEAAGLDAAYVPLEAEDADDLLAAAGPLGLRGASVTAPFKVDLCSRIPAADDAARATGAVNTLKLTGHGWEGANTDVPGFLAPLAAARIEVRRRRAAILGAGGAARAVAVALRQAGARVTVHARRADPAGDVARLAGGAVGPPHPPAGSWDVLVNATPVGTAPDVDATPLHAAALDGELVYDLVYNPLRTRLLADAAAAGCRVIGGLEMLVEQARLQFAWWTGRRLPAAVFRHAAEARLAAMAGDSAEALRHTT